MVKPVSQTLYVMQNEFGLIKIGRSLDPERRRRELAADVRCKIALVHLLPQQGHREEEIHLRLKAHMIEGEWFKGTIPSRRAILRTLPRDGNYVWPFMYDREGAKVWLEELFAQRDNRAANRQYNRLLSHLLSATAGVSANQLIGNIIHYTDSTQPYWGYVLVNRKWVPGYRPKPFGDVILCPPYSTDIHHALAIWPCEQRPASWTGSAMECAFAALKARRSLL